VHGSSTFRFPGFLFSRNKSEKSKHSSLKRAKSGIQLERKGKSTLTTGLSLASSTAAPTTPTKSIADEKHHQSSSNHLTPNAAADIEQRNK
jgi:hypothetical protein